MRGLSLAAAVAPLHLDIGGNDISRARGVATDAAARRQLTPLDGRTINTARVPPWPVLSTVSLRPVDSAWKLVCHRGNEYERNKNKRIRMQKRGCAAAGEGAVRGENEAVTPHGLAGGLGSVDG